MAKNPLTLPKPPSLWKTIGPSFILLGLALGSGEVILWPYLAAHYGVGLLWGALLGISFQYLLNTEAMRYTLAWGESVFVGFRKLSVWITLWMIISTVIPWSLPGFSTASADILTTVFPVLPTQMLMIGSLLLTGLILTLGKTLYQTMEVLEKVIVIGSLLFVLVLASLFTRPMDWQESAWGVVGRGDGWWFFPPGVAIASFLAAFAYSGGGGNLNLAQSHYIKEKGFGMGAYAPKITSLLAGGAKPVSLEGKLFDETPTNKVRWKQWWWLVTREHFFVFWVGGLVSIMMLSVLAHALVPSSTTAEGLDFIFAEASTIGNAYPGLGTLFLLLVALMLFSTQAIVLEASSRIISENILLVFFKHAHKMSLSLAFYIALWMQIGFGILLILSGLQEPRFLLTLAAVLNAGAMMVSFPLLYWLNHRRLKPDYQPKFARKIGLIAAFIFFAVLVTITLRNFQI